MTIAIRATDLVKAMPRGEGADGVITVNRWCL